MRKKLIVALVVIVAVVVIALVLVAVNLNSIVQKAIVTMGPKVLGVPVELEKASISPFRGQVSLEGFALGSPKGFEAPEMFRVGRIYVSANVLSFLGKEMVVHEVQIDAPEITLEIDGVKSNWGTLMNQLEKQEAGEPTAEQEKGPGKTMRIGLITLSNGKVKLVGVPLAAQQGIPLPSVEIKDLGSAEGTGVTVTKVVAGIVRALYKSILEAAGKVLPDEELKKLGQEMGSAIKDIGATGVEKTKGVLKGIGDLLPGKGE